MPAPPGSPPPPPSSAGAGLRLLVRVDGELLGEEEARGLWHRFSAHMETNRGDLAGFAAQEGFASVHPGIEGGRPVLIVSRSSPQLPYGAAPNPSTSGSSGPRAASAARAYSGKKGRGRRS